MILCSAVVFGSIGVYRPLFMEGVADEVHAWWVV
jgi:hypothetical protein